MAVVALVTLHGPDDQIIWVNPAEIVSIRAPQTDLLHSDIKCSLQTGDGKLINVVEACDVVIDALRGAP